MNEQRLNQIKNQYEEIQQRLQEPDTWQNPVLYARLQREALELAPVAEADPNDERSVIMEIRAGVGGEEGALFAGDLYRMYALYAEIRRWKIEVVNLNETELGGIKEISFLVEGENAFPG